MPKIVIEFTGIGGSGKTTIIKLLKQKLKQQNIDFQDLTKLKSKDYGAINLKALSITIKFLIYVKPKSLRDIKKIIINMYRFFKLKVNEQTSGVVIYDEGIIHQIRAMRKNVKINKSGLILQKTSQLIELPTLVYVIESDLNNIIKRRHKRNRPNDLYDKEQIKLEFNDQDFEELLKDVQREYNQFNSKINIVNYKNNINQDIKKISEAILKDIIKDLKKER